jgi:ferredoxin hydrogenase large subunit
MQINRRNLLKMLGGATVLSSAYTLTGCKKMETEHILTANTAPDPADYDKVFYVQVDKGKCRACGTCDDECPTGAITCKTPMEPRRVIHQDLCMNCGQCLINCPFGAIYENVSFVRKISRALRDPDVITVAMIAPAVRYAIGEPFGMKPGEYAGGKMFTALKKLGFNYVWDNEFAADLTILEEGTELIGRITGKIDKPLPQFTSCCPGWIKYAESFYPDLIPNLSTCKSPIAMLGPLAKTYGASKIKAEPKKIFTVSIMPCIAKKFEGLRPEMNSSGFRDIDATINTRELAYMLKQSNIDLAQLTDSEADPIMGTSTGAATIFGASGGVMEAALRFAYEAVTGRRLEKVDFENLRGTKGVREATVALPNGPELKVCVVTGLKNVKSVADQVRAEKSPYHFIEVMTCPGGCINGGGQPLRKDVLESHSWYRGVVTSMSSIVRTLQRITA